MAATTILISGAGIAGPALAYWLKAAGFEPTIVERAGELRSGGYVIDFWGRGYDVAERMGMTDELDRTGYHIKEMRIVDDRGERVAGFGIGVLRELTGGRFVTLARSDLSRLLHEKIRSGTEIIFGDEITALRQHEDHVSIELERCGERRFDLVIGADGLHSSVRRLAFGPQQQYETQLGYRVAAFEIQGYRLRDEDVYIIHNAPGRMLGRVALRDDRTLVLFVFVAGAADPPPDLSAQKALLRSRFGDVGWECPGILDALDRTDELYFDRVSQIRMESWSCGRVALVGDAAFCPSLMAGQGSAMAMTSAYVLAGELARAGGRHQEAYARYEALLRRHMAAKQGGAERFATAFAPRTGWGLLLRNLMVKACAIPGLASLTFGRGIADTLRLPDYGMRRT
jgi:2-polyprenyl-6-methoxyphenol hydroxylase-like FAD-dependent oxidoreductase